MATIEFQDVSKSFEKNTVIADLNLKIEDGSFTVFVGPSGCGKTTMLRMIAGLGSATSGQVLIGGKDVTNVEPGQREVAMVFQNYAIYPTMSVRANIEFGLVNNKVPKEERELRIKEVSEIVGLEKYLDRMPGTLSGGQRQRIALARAMVKQPKVFLMDEPLSNLDAKLRSSMRVELIELHKKLKSTFVYVTHDQIEAMSMADNIVLLNDGVIQQHDTPENIYHDPHNVFTAQFIGNPSMNLLAIEQSEGSVGFRPERAKISKEKQDAFLSFYGEIQTREMLGSETLYKIVLEKQNIMVKSLDESFSVNEKVYISINREDICLFDKNDNRVYEKDTLYNKQIKAVEMMNDAK